MSHRWRADSTSPAMSRIGSGTTSVKSCAKTGLNFCWEKACARKQPR